MLPDMRAGPEKIAINALIVRQFISRVLSWETAPVQHYPG